jgi:hypothetical protein
MWLDSNWRSRSHNVRNEAHLGIAEHGGPEADGPSPEAIRRTAGRNKLPIERITEVQVLDPYFYT